jgi:chromate reductase, NAD(P)H dehydrogenase (quinone)
MKAEDQPSMTVATLCGSERTGSLNRALLSAALDLAPPTLRFERMSIRDLPMYDPEIDASAVPPAVTSLRARVSAAHALLIVTPEHNYSVPALLKNAIDWLSRGPATALAGKPLALMGASPGAGGTVRAQAHLRQIAVFLDLHAINKPEVLLGNAHQAFDADGKLIDEAARGFVRAHLEALAERCAFRSRR